MSCPRGRRRTAAPRGLRPSSRGQTQQPLLPKDRPAPGPVDLRPGPPCDNQARWQSNQGTDHTSADRGDRPGASAIDRRPGDGPLDRDRRRGPGRRGGLADHARVPDPLPLPAGCRRAGRPARGRLGRGGRLRRPLERGEGPAPAVARPPAPPRGRAGPGQEHRLRRLRQGRRRQVDHDRQPGRGPARRRASPAEPSTATSTATRSLACSASTASRRSTRSERSSP